MRIHTTLRLLAVALVAVVLNACGGGGGGSTGKGAFTISATSASFHATIGSAYPQNQSFQVTIQGSGAAYFGVAYAPGQGTQPSWLTVSTSGSGTSFSLVIGVVVGAVTPGSYTTTFSIGTTDASGNVLQKRNFTVTFELLARSTITTPAISQNMIFGETPRARVVTVAVAAPNRDWTASTTQAWLQVAGTTHTGNGSIDLTLDTTALAPGSYSGQLRVAAVNDAGDFAMLPVSITIADPVLTVTPSSLLFGGTDGLAALAPVSVPVSLNTGGTTHPIAVSVTTDNGQSWLQTSGGAAEVGSAGTTFSASATRGSLASGTYTGQLRVTATVFGRTYEQQRPVTLNIEADRMVVSATGIGLSRAGSREVLNRTLHVYSSVGRASMNWQASANVPWLSVTPGGTAGGALVISADPTGLALETTHYGTVTISSPDATIENQQTVRVGLHLTAASPGTVTIPSASQFLAASPVDPWLALSNGGTSVTLYNVYTGAVVRTLSGVAANAGAVTFSDDGRLLYVVDRTNQQLVALDVVTGVVQTTYDAAGTIPSNSAAAVSMLRPAGFNVLIGPSGKLFALSGALPPNSPAINPGIQSLSWSRSTDQTLLAAHTGNTWRLKYSALQGGSITNTIAVSPGTAQGRDGEACISATGDRVYTASGSPYDFPATSTTTSLVVQRLPGTNYPNAMQCVWNGLVIGGADAYYSDYDIFVYNGTTGLERARFSSTTALGGYRSLFDRGLAVSADGTRLASVFSNSSGAIALSQGTVLRDLPMP